MKERSLLTLRPAGNRDCEPVRNLVFSVLREYRLEPDVHSTDNDLEDLQASYWDRGGWFAVLETEPGEIVGTVGLYAISPTHCELRKMYLHPGHRGQGWGRFLLEEALREARNRGFSRMTLETANVLKEAIALYTRYGFTPYEADHRSARCDATYTLDL